VRQQDQLAARRASEAPQAAGARQPQGPVEPPAPPRPSTPLPLRVPFGQTRYSPTGKAARAQNFETQLVLTWVNLVAVITLLLGAGFLFKYGVDNNWFGPVARVGLAAIAAAALLGAGHRLRRKDQKVFAQWITGLGIASGYLTFWAAGKLYDLIPNYAAFLLMCGMTAEAVRLSLLYESEAIAILAILGGYLTPVAVAIPTHVAFSTAVPSQGGHPRILFSYVFLVNLGALALVRLRRWRVLEPLALAATVLACAGWSLIFLDESTGPVVAVFAMAFYAQFSVTREVAVWTAIQILAPLALGLVRGPEGLPWNLAFAAGGLAVAEVRRWNMAPLWTLASCLVPVWLWLAAHHSLGDANVAANVLSAGFVLFFLWTPFWKLVRKREVRAPDLWLIAANAAAYFALAYYELNPYYHAYMGLFAVGLGLLHLLLVRLLKGADTRLVLGVALAFAALAVPIQFNGLAITAGWALEAAGAAWLAARFGNLAMRWGAGVLFVLVLSRLVLIDAWTYSNASDYSLIFNARLLVFAVSVCALWLAAEFTGPVLAEAAVGAYAAAHVVLLFGLSLEIAGWVHRSVAEADQTNVLAVAVALLLTLYAAGLVTVGILTRTAINRILGLGVVTFVVAKLYLMDVWQLDLVFRIAAFLALGGLLLGVSYLYSRYKSSLAGSYSRTLPAAIAAGVLAALALVALAEPMHNWATLNLPFASATNQSAGSNPVNQQVPAGNPRDLVSRAAPAAQKPGGGKPKQAPAAAPAAPTASAPVVVSATPATTPSPAPARAPAPTAPATSPATSSPGLVQDVSAASPGARAHSSTVRTSAASWIWACADGKALAGRVLPGGNTLEIEFSRQATVLVGNAAAVEMALDGKPLGPLGPEGRARVVELTPAGFHLASTVGSPDCGKP